MTLFKKRRLFSLSADKKGKTPSPLLFRLLALLLALVPALFLFNFRLYPAVAVLAESQVSNYAKELIAAAFLAETAGANADFEGLSSVLQKEDGSITGIRTSALRLHEARNRLLLSVLRALKENEICEVSVPLGNLLGGEAMSGRGPRIPVNVVYAGDAGGYMASTFTEAGINQTLYTVSFTVSLHFVLLLPTQSKELTVSESVPIEETVIVGTVPETYMKIHRLTDDITEDEIDGIFDYGLGMG